MSVLCLASTLLLGACPRPPDAVPTSRAAAAPPTAEEPVAPTGIAPPDPIDVSARADPVPSGEWVQLLPSDGAQIHFFVTFQDDESIWRCESDVCRVVYGSDIGRTLDVPCFVDSRSLMDSSPSRSGRWLVQGCDETVYVVDMRSGEVQATEVGKPRLFLGVVDDAGTATVTIAGPAVVRIPWSGAARRYVLDAPQLRAANDPLFKPANGPWLAFTEDVPVDVGWRVGRPPPVTEVDGSTFFNGERVWINRSTKFYRLTPDGALELLSGYFGPGLGGKGMLVSLDTWGERGLILGYEDAVVLVDEQVQTVLTLDMPHTDSIPEVGSNPRGSQLHVAGAHGTLHVHRLMDDAQDPASRNPTQPSP